MDQSAADWPPQVSTNIDATRGVVRSRGRQHRQRRRQAKLTNSIWLTRPFRRAGYWLSDGYARIRLGLAMFLTIVGLVALAFICGAFYQNHAAAELPPEKPLYIYGWVVPGPDELMLVDLGDPTRPIDIGPQCGVMTGVKQFDVVVVQAAKVHGRTTALGIIKRSDVQPATPNGVPGQPPVSACTTPVLE